METHWTPDIAARQPDAVCRERPPPKRERRAADLVFRISSGASRENAVCYDSSIHAFPLIGNAGTRPFGGPGSSGYLRVLGGMGSGLYTACLKRAPVLLLGLAGWSLAADAAPFADLKDPFNTERYVAPAPSMRWQSPAPLPAVPEPPAVKLPAGDRALSLPELTELALQHNPRTRQAWYAARAAAAGIGIEQAEYLPQITGSFLVQRSESGGQGGNQIAWLTRYGPSVTLSWVLFDFGVGDNQVKAAEFLALAAILTQSRVLQDVIFLVEQSYYQYLGTDELVKSNELFLKAVQTSLDATQRRREAGLATVADVYRAETQVAQAQLNLTRSRGGLEKTRGALASAAGLPVNAELRVQRIEVEPRISEVTGSLEGLLARAKMTRADLVAAEAQARAARAQADAAARAGYPTFTVNATTGVTFFLQGVPRTDTNSISLNVSIPLFTGFRQTYALRQAEARAAQAEASRDVLTRQTELDVWQSYYDVQTAADAVNTTAVQLKAAQQTAEATLARYQSGFGSLLDLITAQLDESNARVQRIQSYLDWFVAVARLNYAIGADDKMMYAIQPK
jgi:outer membrane protein